MPEFYSFLLFVSLYYTMWWNWPRRWINSGTRFKLFL